MPFQLSAAMAVFIATIALSLVGLFKLPKLVEACLFRPYWLTRKGQYHSVISSGFVHADMGHLLFNMITFYFFALPLERHIGGKQFLVLYFSGLVLSHAGTYLKHRHNPGYASLGASGAISAVLFAFIVFFPTSSLFIIPIPVPIPAPLFAIAYLAYSYYAARQQKGRINHDAHWNGALTGLVFVAMVEPAAYGRLPQIVMGWFG